MMKMKKKGWQITFENGDRVNLSDAVLRGENEESKELHYVEDVCKCLRSTFPQDELRKIYRELHKRHSPLILGGFFPWFMSAGASRGIVVLNFLEEILGVPKYNYRKANLRAYRRGH